MAPSRDVIVRFVGDTGNLAKGADEVSGRLRGVATSLQGVAKLGAAVGAVSFFGTMISEARDAERTGKQTEAVLRSTGGAANLTAKQIGDLAGKLSEKTAVDDEVIQHGENVLLTFKNVRDEAGKGNDVFSQTTGIALDMSAALSENGDASEGLQSNMTRLGKALNDPIAGIGALTKVGVTFTDQQKTQIKSLTESGDIMGAQKIILAELKSEFGGMAEASADSIGKAQVSWGNFAEEIGSKVMPAVNAVSNWALTTGIPALGNIAEVVGDVVTPVFHAAAEAGGGLVGVWQSLPGPVQASAVAMGVWALAGDRVTGFLSRSAGPFKNFNTQVSDMQRYASASGTEIGKMGASFAVLEGRSTTVAKVGSAFRTAKGDASGFGSTVRGVASAGFTGLKSAAGGAMGLLGGPWGLVIGGATVLLGSMMSASDQAAEEQQHLADAGKRVAQAIAEQNGVIDESIRKKAAQEAEDAGLLANAEKFGIATTQITDAIIGQKGAVGSLTTQLEAYAEQHSRIESGEGGATVVYDREGAAALKLRDKIQQVAGAKVGEVAASQRVTNATKETGASQASAMTASELYRQAIERAGIEFDSTASEAEQLKAAIDAVTAAEMARQDTLESYEAAQDALTSAIQANGRTLDIHTEKGRANADALEDTAKKSRDLMQADIDSGVPANQALKRHDDRIAALRKEARETFGAKSQADKLITTYSKVPKDVRTAIRQSGYEDVNRKIMDLSAKQFLLAQGKPVTQQNIRAVNQEKRWQRSGSMATGGPIDGPGGPTSDVIPIWASSGEFMQRAAAVDYYGVPFMKALNDKQIPKGLVQGLAHGGPVIWPFNVNLRKTKIPSPPVVPVSGAASGSPAVVAAVRAVAARFGWGSGGQWNALSSLISHESGWNPSAANPSSSARGLFQKLTSVNGPVESTVGGQANWGLNYIRGRYGSPANAWAAWNSRSPHWYDQGGWLKPGGVGVNGTSKPEAVLTGSQWDKLDRLIDALEKLPQSGNQYVLNANVTNTPADVAQQFRRLELLDGL